MKRNTKPLFRPDMNKSELRSTKSLNHQYSTNVHSHEDMVMKIRMRPSALALGAFLLSGMGTASAYPYSASFACATFLNAVGEKITTAQFLGKNALTDQRNLIFKLDAASAKLMLNTPKYEDAIAKLEDISRTAYDLASAEKPKLDNFGAAAIIDAAGNAINQCLVTYLK